jgi:hypothetical protein
MFTHLLEESGSAAHRLLLSCFHCISWWEERATLVDWQRSGHVPQRAAMVSRESVALTAKRPGGRRTRGKAPPAGLWCVAEQAAVRRGEARSACGTPRCPQRSRTRRRLSAMPPHVRLAVPSGDRTKSSGETRENRAAIWRRRSGYRQCGIQSSRVEDNQVNLGNTPPMQATSNSTNPRHGLGSVVGQGLPARKPPSTGIVCPVM